MLRFKNGDPISPLSACIRTVVLCRLLAVTRGKSTYFCRLSRESPTRVDFTQFSPGVFAIRSDCSMEGVIVRAMEPKDVPSVLELQAANNGARLSTEEAMKEGFLSCMHTSDYLNDCIRLAPMVVAVVVLCSA